MIITNETLKALRTGFRTLFQEGLTGVKPNYERFCTVVDSQTASETYGWLGDIPGMRQWIGDRQLQNLSEHKYTIENVLYEDSVEVEASKIKDDILGVYRPMFQMMGEAAARHPDELAYQMLSEGTTNLCYDKKSFFSASHPGANGKGTQSNFATGSSDAWYLLDTTRAIKPLIFQSRESAANSWTALDRETDENVFMRNRYVYGISARYNVGYAFWQMAYCGKVTLDATNYATARTAMMSLVGEKGKKLNIVPNLLIVPPTLESSARSLLVSQVNASGASNPWFGTAELLVVPQLA